MYRSNKCILSKTRALVSSRSRVATARTRFLLETANIIKHKGSHEQFMSSVSKGKSRNRLYYGYSVAFCTLLFGGGVTYLAKENESFRKAVENAIPLSETLFSYVIPRRSLGDEVTVGDATVSSQIEELQIPGPGEHKQEEVGENGDDDGVFLNVLDVPSPSQIDFEVAKERPPGDEITEDDLTASSQLEEELQMSGPDEYKHEEVGEKGGDDGVFLNVMDVPSPSQIDFEVGKEQSPGDEITVDDLTASSAQLEEIQISVPGEHKQDVGEKGDNDEVFLNEMDVPSSQVDFQVREEHGTEGKGRIVGKENGAEIKVGIDSEPSKNSITIPQQSQILTTAYENLKILVDDTITTKTSAAGMLHGYITQFGQALSVPKEDLAYKSIWDVNSALEQSILESIDLTRTKESEVNLLVKNIKALINDIREAGTSELADKAEELIASVDESLLWVESEIKLLTQKVNILQGFRKQCVECPERLQKDLHMFIPDLIRLLNLKHFDLLNLSYEDAVLLLSLRRVEFIYDEVREKEAAQKLLFEATLQTVEENVQKAASDHLNYTIEKLMADKDNELTEKVNDLRQLHEKHIQEELKMQHEVHQQELLDAQRKLITELTDKYETELELILGEQENRHYHEVTKNLSYLKGIESKITDVLDVDDKSWKNQHLWAAVHAFNTSLNEISDNGRTKELISEMSNILQGNHNDDILCTIVSTVPEAAASFGVIPANALIQHFCDVKRVCKRVAMVQDEGGSIFAYAFSYIKSLFVISRFYQRRVSDEIDLESLGPYEILEKADYYIQQGDLEQAVKFMSQLKGAPRRLSSDWIKEVRLFLETRQTANLLVAYALGSLIGFE